MGILCQIDPLTRFEKPSSPSEYGRMRDRMIQQKWDFLGEEDFVKKVTLNGQAFFGCLYRGRDLMEFQSQKECWLTQTLVGVDFDHCPVDPYTVSELYSESGFPPWLGYETFSESLGSGDKSFRLLWRVQVDLNSRYEDTFTFIRFLSSIPGEGLSDRNSRDPGRLWQGTRKGHFLYDPKSKLVLIPSSR